MQVGKWFKCLDPKCLLFTEIVGCEVDPKFAEPEISHHHLISVDELGFGKDGVHFGEVRSNFLLVEFSHFGFVRPFDFGESTE